MKTFGEPPRFVRFRVDQFPPHDPKNSAFKPEFPHVVWVEFPEFGVCRDGKAKYAVVKSSIWQARLDAGFEIEELSQQLVFDAAICGCMGEIIE